MALLMVSPMAMIPHHFSAILVTKNVNLKHPEVIKLSKGIIASQEALNRRNENHFNKDGKLKSSQVPAGKNQFQ